jgi:putative glutamine amidotransferase
VARRPVIGVCAAFEPAAWSFWNEAAHLVSDSYVGNLQRAGALVVLFAVDEREPEPLVDAVDGLLLVGGADLDPASYGAERSEHTEATVPIRDAFEIVLVKRAVERRVPVLGICRGMQILNVAMGGTLDQHLADEQGETPHRRRLGSFDGTDHDVRLSPGSLAARACGAELCRVHCHHHQIVGDIGVGLTVTGWDELDGVPEALEASDGSWTLGVQWHPEAVRDGELIRNFVAACGVVD